MCVVGCNSEEKACDAFVGDLTVCYDDFCDDDGGDTAFCACWDQGMDLDITTCNCAPSAACEILDLSDYVEGDANCAAASSAVGDFCDE